MQEIITVGSDKILQLANGQCARQPIYGSTWTKIRIGLRLCFPAVATLTGTPRFVVGVCNGPASSGDDAYGNANTNNFTGVYSDESSYTLAGTPGTNGYFGGIGFKCIKKVATTVTPHASSIGATTNNYLSATEAMRSCLIVQIEKGSPNYTFRLVTPLNSTGAQHDVSDTEFLQMMEADSTFSSLPLSNYTAKASNNTLAVDEGAGTFDHINVFWDRTSVKCQISDIAHRLIA